MENNKKEDMVFVSFDRLRDNFKKFWWIAGCAYGVYALIWCCYIQQFLKDK